MARSRTKSRATPSKNFTRATGFIATLRNEARRSSFFLELFRSRSFFCQTEDHANFALAEEIPGRSTSTLGELARELGVVIIASLFEKRSAGVYHNTAAIIDADGKLLGKYRKMHIPDDPLYHEKFYFTPGDLGFQAWETARGKIGVCVCWDQWYPEAARLTALRGAGKLFLSDRDRLASEPRKKEFGAAQHSAWETIQRSHAIANGCYVAAAKSRRSRSAGRRSRNRILGPKFCLCAERRDHRERFSRSRRNCHRRYRLERGRSTSDALAISARPPRRCLRRN